MAEAIKHPEREEKNVLRATIYIQQILMHEISEMSDGALFLRRDLMMLRLPMGEMATVERVLVILWDKRSHRHGRGKILLSLKA